MYTLGSLRTLVLSWLDDPSAQYFTIAQCNVWLNNAQREAQKQLIQSGNGYFLNRNSTNTVQYQDTYALPPGFIKLNKLEVVLSPVPVVSTTGSSVTQQNRRTLAPVTLIQLDGVSTNTGSPQCYTFRKNAIVIRPVPDNTYTLYIDWVDLVSDMNFDTDVPNVPLGYQEYLAVLATLDGLIKDQRDPSTMLEKKKYYQELMKEDMQERHIDYPKQVVITEDNDYTVYY